MAITPGLLGALSAVDGPIPPPAGLPAAPTRLAVVLTWFGLAGPPAIAGWTLAGTITDARPIDPTFTALFFVDVPDGSAVGAVTPTGISFWLGQMLSIDGDIDPVFQLAMQADATFATVAPGPLVATSNGSFLLMACGCWNFSAWQESGFGGAQIYPPGFVPTLGNTNATELGGFYLDAIPAGAVDTTFGTAVERFAVVAVLFAPAETPPPGPPPMTCCCSPLGTPPDPPPEGPEGLTMTARNGLTFTAPSTYVLGTDPIGDISMEGSGTGNFSLPDSSQAQLTYNGPAGNRYLVQGAFYLNGALVGDQICAAVIGHNADMAGLAISAAGAVNAGRLAGTVVDGVGQWLQAIRITPPLAPGDTIGVYFCGNDPNDRVFMSGKISLVQVNTL